MTNIRKADIEFNSNTEFRRDELGKRRRRYNAFDPLTLYATEKQPKYATPKYPKKIRKPEQFLNVAEQIFNELAISVGGAVKYRLPEGQSRGYTDHFLNKLKDHGLLKIKNGQRGIRECIGVYQRGKNKGKPKYRIIKEWEPRRLYPSPLLVEALSTYYAPTTKPELTGNEILDELNQFYSQVCLKGAAQPLMTRSQDKATKCGSGRFYAKGLNNYQNNLKRGFRCLSIDGDKDTVEADITASHLRALLVEYGYSNHPDPYSVGCLKNFNRDEVKAATMLFIGSSAYSPSKKPTSWYQDPDYGKDGKFFENKEPDKVVKAILKEYPFLENLPKGKFFELSWKESNAMKKVLLKLKQENIVALSMHDGCIIRRVHFVLCKQYMEQEYEREFGVVPPIKMKEPNQSIEHLSEGYWYDDDFTDQDLKHAHETVTRIINEILAEFQITDVKFQLPGLTASTQNLKQRYIRGKTKAQTQQPYFCFFTHVDAVNPNKPVKIKGKHGGKRAGAGGWNRGEQLHLKYGVSRTYIHKLKKKGLLEQYIQTGKLKLKDR